MQLQDIAGIGAKSEKTLIKAGLSSALDLLLHLPKSYEDRTEVVAIRALVQGQMAQVYGRFTEVKVVQSGRRKWLNCVIEDDHHQLTVKFFHFYPNQISQLSSGAFVLLYGQVRRNGWALEMIHPEWDIIRGALELPECLTPVYPSVQGISSTRLRRLIHTVLNHIEQLALTELIPSAYRQQFGLTGIIEALPFIHRPPKGTSVERLLQAAYPQQKTLIFEELAAHCLSAQQVRTHYQHQSYDTLSKPTVLQSKLTERLPFRLTKAQHQVVHTITEQLYDNRYVCQLIQGDVGSGKTVVAALAMLPVLENGFQVLLMVPTEILAYQHQQKFEHWLAPWGINVTLLVGQQSAKVKQQKLDAIASGDSQLIIGTHALFQKDIRYHQVAMVIIDEQHRFGVQQRLDVLQKGQWGDKMPHQLVLSATPIPRTLAMTLYGDLDIALINDLPPGRHPIKTAVVSNDKYETIIERLKHYCQTGHQAYWVCSLVEDTETEMIQHLKSVDERFKTLQRALPDVRIGMVHGKMHSKDKAATMQAFTQGNIQLLVATTVIEVGVDVPNATIMIIENAERLGLSQLHQLRGRVGRGTEQGHCLLMYHPPLSADSQARLEVMRNHTDGFVIAQKDLELRGPGQMLGVAQTGSIGFKVANLMRDQYLMNQVQQLAVALQTHHPDLGRQLMSRWHHSTMDYAKV